MRTVDPAVIAGLDTSRVVDGRLTFRDTRLRFASTVMDDPANFISYDSDYAMGTILRVASVWDSPVAKLEYQNVNPANDPDTWGAWVYAAIDLMPHSNVAVYGKRVFFTDDSGNLSYADYTGGSLDPPVVIETNANPTFVAPVSGTVIYVMRRIAPGVGDTYQAMRIRRLDLSAVHETTYPGVIYDVVNAYPTFDALTFGDFDYIFFTEQSQKRSMYMTWIGNDVTNWTGVWSDISPVMPMDVLDDTSLFSFGAPSVVNSQLYLTGHLLRPYSSGETLNVYLTGAHFGIGRDMYIGNSGIVNTEFTISAVDYSIKQPFGKLYLIGNYVLCIGPDTYYKADATYQVGVDASAKKYTTSAFRSISFGNTSSSGTSLTVELASDVSSSIIAEGSTVDVEVGYDDEMTVIGIFVVDRAIADNGPDGKRLMVHARARGLGALSDWTSDSSYDYWSQTKTLTDASLLDSLVRFHGSFEDFTLVSEGNPTIYRLVLSGINESGFLYSADRACRGYMAYAKFTLPATTSGYSARCGILLNFRVEPYTTAEDRLASEAEEAGETQDVTEDDLISSAVRAVYNSYAEEVEVSFCRGSLHSQWSITVLGTFALTIPMDSTFWLCASYQDGYIRVMYRPDTSDTWQEVGTTYCEDNPYFDDDFAGRPGIYLLNYTTNSTAYPFTVDDRYIPVADNSNFPTTDVVLVDEEQIEYSGKSNNSGQTNLLYSHGVIVEEFDTTPDGTQDINDNRDRTYARQSMTIGAGVSAVLVAIAVHVKKTGTPTSGLRVSVYSAPTSSLLPLGSCLASGVVPEADITGTAGWHTVTLDTPCEVSDAKTYWVICSRESQPYIADATNYYTLSTKGSATYDGQLAVFDEDGDVWSDVANTSAMFKAYGADNYDNPVVIVQDVTHPTDVGEFDGMALTATAGTGLGETFHILAYSPLDTGIGAFQVDRDPYGLFGEDTVFSLVPTLSVVTRGYDSTIAVSHALGAIVSVYRSVRVFVEKFVGFSLEKDYTTSEAIVELCEKAGVTVEEPMLVDGAVNSGSAGANWNIAAYYPLRSGIVMIHPDGVYSDTREIGVAFNNRMVSITDDTLRFWSGSETPTMLEEYPLDFIPMGWTTISAQTTSINEEDGSHNVLYSVWNSGRLLHAFQDRVTTASYLAITTPHDDINIYVKIPEINVRRDSFILDMGLQGGQLLDDLVGEKRIYYRDNQSGGIDLIKTRVTVPDTYDFEILDSYDAGSPELKTRLVVEGIDVVEVVNTDNLRDHGNLFALARASEPTTKDDLLVEASALLDEIELRTTVYTMTGAADPRIETDDIVTVERPEGVIDVVVKSVGYELSIEETAATFDIDVQGLVV